MARRSSPTSPPARWPGEQTSAPTAWAGAPDAGVAARFELFEARLRHAWNDGRPDLHKAFENVGRAYLAFARDEPSHYSAMFEAGVPHDADPGLRDAANRAFEVLRQGAEALCAAMPGPQRPPALMVALHVWALSHGIASLFARGDRGRRALPMTPEELLEAGVLVYLRGLGAGGEIR